MTVTTHLTAADSGMLVWFATAILCEVVFNYLFYAWLIRRGVHLVWGMRGVPGYLEIKYTRWCRQEGRSPGRVVGLRIASIFNLVAASAVYIGWFSRK